MSHPANPYGPPQSQPAQPTQLVHPAQATQPYPYPAPGQAWSQPVMPPYGAPPRQRNGLAVAAVAMSAVALLVSLGIAAFIAIGVASGGSGVLTGTVAPSGGAFANDVLVPALTSVIEDDGGSVGKITCPGSSAVGQGLVTVCHGSVDGFDDWTGIVVFEDSSGTFSLQEL